MYNNIWGVGHCVTVVTNLSGIKFSWCQNLVVSNFCRLTRPQKFDLRKIFPTKNVIHKNIRLYGIIIMFTIQYCIIQHNTGNHIAL